MVLTPEEIEAELRRTKEVTTAGVLIAMRLREPRGGAVPMHGDYTMYLRVERVP